MTCEMLRKKENCLLTTLQTDELLSVSHLKKRGIVIMYQTQALINIRYTERERNRRLHIMNCFEFQIGK